MHGREKLQTTQVRLLFLFSFFCARCVKKKKYTVIVLSNALDEAPHALFEKNRLKIRKCSVQKQDLERYVLNLRR